ncbi:MAG: MerC mercury resistance protein [Sphingobium sp.]|uniref:MerC domain-containing protein n=1 Tax=Sphingobium sp. TaxID=1912891 RepID=UPI000DB08298|nr:MerC domain-containing protein [Sphingobium sp.]PZU12334.1 MAG: MerC mercury resistance protein [Sphingobium sp.]
MAANTEGQRLFDGVAIGASILCLIHCLVLPVLIVLLPTLTAFLIVPEAFHLWALGLAVPTSVLALTTGYRRHRKIKPTIVALPGLILLAGGALLAPNESKETILSVAGALLLALGHGLNWQALHDNGALKKGSRTI